MPGLTSLPDASTVARIVLAATGEVPDDLRIVGQGVAAIAWRVDCEGGSYAVLIARPDAVGIWPPMFEARAAVLDALRERDARCPRPIATHRSDGIPESLRGGLPWAVTSWVEGEPVEEMNAEVARDVGELLAALHAIPSTGYGLIEDHRDVVRGSLPTREGALQSLFLREELWPYSGKPLAVHPLVRVVPRLVLAVGELREQLLAYEATPGWTVCHTDLHEGHILVREGRLVGVIDFGDAGVAPPALDIASFAYFHGWPAADALLEGYTTNSVLRDIRRAEAQQLAVVLCLQKIEKYTKRETHAEYLARTVAFLEETLPLARRRADA